MFTTCQGAQLRTLLFCTAIVPFLPSLASAQGVGQRTETPEQDIIVVEGKAILSQTAIGAEEARRELKTVPGAIGLVEAEVFLDDFAQSIGDTLLFTPGVFADTSAQREARLSIRGSGLNSGFERRGLTVRRDGVPISRASGSTEFQEVDPLTIDYIEVYKGANGLAYGAASLGGAINIVTPTGLTQKERFTARMEGGSFGTVRASASAASADGPWDLYVGTTGLQSDGYREQSAVNSVYNHTNLGYRFGSGVETRFYLTALSDNFELAGALSFDDALNDPTSAGRPVTIGPFFPGGPVTVLDPGPVADDWDRNLDVVRLANKTVVPLGEASLELGAWYAYRDLDHAITRFAGIIDQQEDEFGGFFRFSGDASLGGLPVSWLVGGEGATSTNDAKRFENIDGSNGNLRARSDQKASNLLAYGQLDIEMTSRLSAILGAQYLSTRRENEDVLNTANGEREDEAFNPRFGLLYQASENSQLFANVSKSFEPATISDLTAGGILDFTPLRAQEAWTAEIGYRGQSRYLAWDIAFYRSWIEDEFVDLAQEGFNGAVTATFNADETVHQGAEVGVDVFLTPQEREVRLLWRNIYTFNDFFFTSNPSDLDGQSFQLDGNELAGVPRHVYIGELRAEHDRWYAALNLRYIPDGPFADYTNSFEVPGYELLGVTAGFDVTEKVRVFASAENLTDEVYISNVATVADFERQGGNIFTPGQGRGFFGGVSVGF
ncbi:MAG: TonB-dependent receptor [Pseudomonadota bacterium]